ncbi:MAG: tetratricopeptide repeat protein, partial [Chloroflexota bacterium]
VELHGKRNAVSEINTQLNGEAHRFFVIFGRGGLGKSALAKNLFHIQLKADRFDSVVWVNFKLSEQATTQNVFELLTRSIGEHLRISDLNLTSAESRLGQITGVLKDTRYLLFIDGVENPDHAQVITEKFSPILLPPSKILMTSRFCPRLVPNSSFYSWNLEEIDRASALTLLKAKAEESGPAGFPADRFTLGLVEKIYTSVGGHPLTLLLFPELLSNYPIDVLLNQLDLGEEGYHSFIYEKVWESLSAHGRQIIWILCFYRTIGAGYRELKGVTDLSDQQMKIGTDELRRFGLIQNEYTDNSIHFTVHNLTIQYLGIVYAQRQSPTEQALFHKAADRLFGYWQDFFSQTSPTFGYDTNLKLFHMLKFSHELTHHPNIADLRAHLLYMIFGPIKDQGFLNIWADVWEFSARYDMDENDLYKCRLLNQLAFIKQKLREFDQALSMHQTALKIAYDLEESAEIAGALHQMSWCYFLTEKLDHAIEHNARSIDIFKEFEINNEDYANALLRKGIFSSEKGDFEAAEEQFQKNISFLERNKFHHALPRAHHNFGLFFYEYKDKPEQAVEQFQLAKKHLRNHPNRILEARVLIAQTALYLDLQKTEDALRTIEETDKDFLERTHNFHLLNSHYTNCAFAMIQSGKFEEARPIVQDALIYRRNQGQKVEILILEEAQAEIEICKGNGVEGIRQLHSIYSELNQPPMYRRKTKISQRVMSKIELYSSQWCQ